jgi:hypothetical protein
MQDRALFHAEQLPAPLLMGIPWVIPDTIYWHVASRSALVVCDSRPVYSEEAVDLCSRWTPSRERVSHVGQYIVHFRIRPDECAPQEVHRYIARSAARQLPSGMWIHKIDAAYMPSVRQ